MRAEVEMLEMLQTHLIILNCSTVSWPVCENEHAPSSFVWLTALTFPLLQCK